MGSADIVPGVSGGTIAFITGIHVCLGATLARIEGRIAIGKFVARFPKLQQAGEKRLVPLARFRGYATLPVRLR